VSADLMAALAAFVKADEILSSYASASQREIRATHKAECYGEAPHGARRALEKRWAPRMSAARKNHTAKRKALLAAWHAGAKP
jgi:hypothetical protein